MTKWTAERHERERAKRDRDRERRKEAIAAEVATWPRLTPERKAELRRLLLPAADRLRAAQPNDTRRSAKEEGDAK